MNDTPDLTGKRFRRLTVEGAAFAAPGGPRYWRCRCDCGKIAVVKEEILLHGTQKMCSRMCKLQNPESEKTPKERKKRKPTVKKRKKRKPTVKGNQHKNYRHGGTAEGYHSRLYVIWHNMKCRCQNKNHPAYARYGGKGIRVCEEWEKDFAVFQEWAISSGYTDDMTIDRIDNSKGYTPENCQWLTKSEHAKKTNQERKRKGTTNSTEEM